ncbi:MAG: multiheme c-type cytochrome [bacterium]
MKKLSAICFSAWLFSGFFISAQAKIKVRVSDTFLSGSDRYLGAATCKECHRKIFQDWEQSMHSKAFLFLGDKERENPVCLRCHCTGYGVAGGYAGGETDLKGVQCEACHGPYGGHLRAGRVVSKKAEKKPEKIREDNCRDCLIRKQCMPCHTPRHSPDFVFEEYYLEIKHIK